MAQMHRIVCGVDFGTTYTAVAWTETSNPNHIEIIQNWPTAGQLVGNQVPTEIAYAEGDTTNFSWGYDISPRVKKVGLSEKIPIPYTETLRSNGSSSAWIAKTMF